MSEGEAKKCPKCSGELEKGYAVALGVLGWDNVKPSLKQEFWRGPSSRELLTPLFHIRTATFPAVRCGKCQIILIEYKSTGVSLHA
jgi:predicted nucleic-acid-binding Zn-ribbon protein